MIGDILVGIAIRFTSNGVLTMERLAAATAGANARLNEQTAALARQQAAMQRMRGMVAGGIAIGGAAAIIASIKAAADLQIAMVNVRAATGASADEFDRLQRMVVATSGITAQSATTIARELGAAASAGLNQPGRLLSAFPQIAKAADVLWLSPKNIDAVESVTQMSKLSHLFAAYSGKPLAEMIDQAVRLMYTQPENVSKLINQGKYFIPAGLSLGVSMHDLFLEAQTMGQTGLLTGRGGTGLARYLEYLAGSPSITEFRSKVQRKAFMDLGLFDASGRNKFVDAQGHLELERSISYLTQLRKSMTDVRFASDVYQAFLQQGGQYILAVTRPEVQAQKVLNEQAAARLAPPGQAVEVIWQQYAKTLKFAFNDFWTNVVNVMMETFSPTLPALTKFFTDFANVLRGWADWLYNHKDFAFGIAIAAMGTVVSAARYAASQLINLSATIEALGLAARRGTLGGPGGVFLGGGRGAVAAAEDAPLFSRMAKGLWGFVDQFFLFGLGSAALGKLTGLWRPIAASIETLAIRAMILPGILGRLATSFVGFAGALRGLLGPFGAILTTLDNAKATGPGGPSWTGLSGMSTEQIRNYIHRTGWSNVSPDVREHWTKLSGAAGGQAFSQDILKRALISEGFAPLMRSLVGGAGATSVTDTISRSSKETTSPIVAGLSRIEALLAGLGITVNVAGAPGQPSRTFHEILSKPHTNTGGFSSAPFAAKRLGFSYRP
jgi:TP901 family phage tail tape measure protein